MPRNTQNKFHVLAKKRTIEDSQVVNLETYILNLQADINLLMEQLESEKTEREEFQTQ